MAREPDIILVLGAPLQVHWHATRTIRHPDGGRVLGYFDCDRFAVHVAAKQAALRDTLFHEVKHALDFARDEAMADAAAGAYAAASDLLDKRKGK